MNSKIQFYFHVGSIMLLIIFDVKLLDLIRLIYVKGPKFLQRIITSDHSFIVLPVTIKTQSLRLTS